MRRDRMSRDGWIMFLASMIATPVIFVWPYVRPEGFGPGQILVATGAGMLVFGVCHWLADLIVGLFSARTP